jgi:superfamily II DNA or RNA helicase
MSGEKHPAPRACGDRADVLVDGIDGSPCIRSSLSRPHLRAYQVETLARIDAAIANGQRRIVVAAPTGSGKTVTAGALIERAVSSRQRVLFLSHRRELNQQASRKLHDVAVDHGIIQAGFTPRPGQQVQVASIQALHARAIRNNAIELPSADLVIVDEGRTTRGLGPGNG